MGKIKFVWLLWTLQAQILTALIYTQIMVDLLSCANKIHEYNCS